MTSLWKSKDPHENPNFSVLVYGVTDDKPGNIRWLEESLYHRPMTEEELKMNKFLDLVDAQTPPAFLVHAYDDDVCHVSESTLYAQELFEHKIPVEMHLFTKGGHGFGLGRKVDGTDQWLSLLVNWLKTNPF
jgi:dipeptidyl aminopeptidase/acylaminoacyl peptidase